MVLIFYNEYLFDYLPLKRVFNIIIYYEPLVGTDMMTKYDNELKVKPRIFLTFFTNLIYISFIKLQKPNKTIRTTILYLHRFSIIEQVRVSTSQVYHKIITCKNSD